MGNTTAENRTHYQKSLNVKTILAMLIQRGYARAYLASDLFFFSHATDSTTTPCTHAA